MIIVLFPLFIIISIAIYIDNPGPIFFIQNRIGLGGKTFKLYKFRSMIKNSEFSGSGVYSKKDDPRVTRVGRLIRSTSLDELPQLFNVLKGDMSLIGPRPPLLYHPWPLNEYSKEQLRMFDVRPGITGWAQIHGRKEVEWNKRIQLNIWYVDNISFWLDIKIFFKTIIKVIINSNNVNDKDTVIKNGSKIDEHDN